MTQPIRRLGPTDLPLLVRLEKACYDPPRRSSPRSLRRSLASRMQEAWAIDDDAALVLWRRPATWRVYGIHTHPSARGQGLAGRLLEFAEARAKAEGAVRMVLEADALDAPLVGWYRRRGYDVVGERPDFYAPGRPAVRMQKTL